MNQDAARIAMLRADAAGDDPQAWYRLAVALVERNDLDEAFELHARAARAGHADACVELARMLLYGIAGDPDPAGAVQWLTSAESHGHPVASYLLALVALGGVALPRDGRINARMKAAIEARYPPALLAAAVHFGRKPAPGDQALCVRMLEDAASLGEPNAALLLAARLEAGEGVPPDPAAAAAVHARLARDGIAPLPATSAPQVVATESPAAQLALEDVFARPSVRLLSQAPRVGVADGLLSRDECRLLMASARPALRDSQAVDPLTGQPVRVQLRTSSDASFGPIAESVALRLVQLRMCAAAGIDLPQSEPLTVLRYAPGQEYKPHRDYVPAGRLEHDRPQAGNRARTICAYLNDVDAGGETDFPVAGVRIAPIAGSAVVFDNLHADGRADPDSLHAGRPVERGVKWLATLWLRQGQYRDF